MSHVLGCAVEIFVHMWKCVKSHTNVTFTREEAKPLYHVLFPHVKIPVWMWKKATRMWTYYNSHVGISFACAIFIWQWVHMWAFSHPLLHRGIWNKACPRSTFPSFISGESSSNPKHKQDCLVPPTPTVGLQSLSQEVLRIWLSSLCLIELAF